MRSSSAYFLFILIISVYSFLFLTSSLIYAETTTYRSAGWVSTDGNPQYANISGCQLSNDGQYCSRPSSTSYGTLYFSSFGTLADFGIPSGSSITKLHIRVKGKNTDSQLIALNTAKNQMPISGSCQLPSDMWSVFLGNVDSIKELHTYTSANGLTGCITENNIDQEKLTFTLRRSSGAVWSADIDNFEIAFDYTSPVYPWLGVGNLSIPRYSHTDTLLNNGKVLIVGGERTGLPVQQTELYDPTLKKWSHVALLNTGRKMHTTNLLPANAASDGGSVLVAGGIGNSGMLSSVELFNPSNNIWTNVGNLNSARIFHASSVLADGKVLVTGGSVDASVTPKHNSTEMYDPTTKSWTLKASLNTARGYHQQVTFKDAQGNQKIMVIGGVDGSGVVGASDLASVEIYDPASNTWTLGPSMSSARKDFRALVLHDGRIIVVGGNNAGDSEVYNPITNSWISYQTVFPFFSGGSTALLDNQSGYKVLAAGGNTTELRAQLFDPIANTWAVASSMTTPRSRFTLTTLTDGSVVAAGGISQGGQTTTSELYRPPQVLGDTPTPTASPTPEPFLDLPWDHGKNYFIQNAFNPNSWFDHKYPLQNILCCTMKVLIYTGKEIDDAYRSHSGYDYASINKVYMHTPVLAAASGSAIYVPESKSGGAGHMIKIDHKNGYQTWYEHLHWDDSKADHGLIVDKEGVSVDVTRGQQIGMVGMSGNTNGPHIHFSVFKDENNNNNFADDYPYGLVDPLGWEGEDIDPWTEYSNADNIKHGAKSYNLFMARVAPVLATIPISGGILNTDKIKVQIPNGASAIPFTLHFKDGPFESSSATLKSATPSFFLTALNSLGEKITNFLNPVTITYSYKEANLLNIKEDTLKLYHYNEATNIWEPLPSTIDKEKKTITGETTSFSQFAVMGELKDTQSPVTEHLLQGNMGKENWYKSAISIILSSEDNEDGVGLEYTLYKLNNNEWVEFQDPILVENEGKHTVFYKAIDKAYNLEEQKSLEFHIDKTAPVTSASASGEEGLGGWFVSDVTVKLSAEDNGEIDRTEYSLDHGTTYVSYKEPFVISSEGIREVWYRSIDKAGNVEEAKKLVMKIDKTAPDSVVYTTGSFGEDNWYRSDVSVSFNAFDGASGFDKTFYSLDGENFEEYINPLTIVNEGETEIIYYSVDKAGNKELQKSIKIKVDKTAPEAEIKYDLSKFDVIVTGKDDFSEVKLRVDISSKLNPKYTLTDLAGNSLVIATGKIQIGKQVTQTLKSLQYNNEQVIVLDRNIFFTFVYTDRNNVVKQLDQYVSMRGDKRIFTNYSSNSNVTKIFTKNLGQSSYTREDKSGIVLLKLYTDKGAIKYNY